MEKFVYYSELYNIYSFLLTDKQREISDLYFNENLSLSEIAENKNVSKSYVGKISFCHNHCKAKKKKGAVRIYETQKTSVVG